MFIFSNKKKKKKKKKKKDVKVYTRTEAICEFTPS